MTTQNERIEIPLSKIKLIWALIGAIIFVIIGIWFVFDPPQTDHRLFGNPAIIFAVGLAAILFFGSIIAFSLRKLFDTKPGLIVNEKGIVDQSTAVSLGLIPWVDIEEIRIAQVASQKFLMVIVKNPQTYIERVKNPLLRKTAEMNLNSYGSPISLSANSLKIKFDELHNLLQQKLQSHNP